MPIQISRINMQNLNSLKYRWNVAGQVLSMPIWSFLFFLTKNENQRIKISQQGEQWIAQ